MFKAFRENNQVEFTKVVHEVIEDEKRKNHIHADIERVCVESMKYCIINSILEIHNYVFEKMIMQEDKRD